MRVLFFTLALTIGLSQTACSAQENSSNGGTENPPSSLTVTTRVESMKIRIKVGDKEATGALNDSPAAHDFASLLPLTLELEDYVKKEKIGYPARKLTTASGNNADGDIAYYARWGNLAIFYEDVPSSGGGLIILGRIDSNKELFNVPGSLKVTIEIVK